MPILLPNGEIIEPIIINDNDDWSCNENGSSSGEESNHVQEEPLIWLNGRSSNLQLVNPNLKEKDDSDLELLSDGDCEIVSISSEEDSDIASIGDEDYEIESFEDVKKENKLFVKIEEGIRKSGDLPLLAAETKEKSEVHLKDIKRESVSAKTESIEHKPVITLQPKCESVALNEACQGTSSLENSSSYTVQLRPRRKRVLCHSDEDRCKDCPSCKEKLRPYRNKQKPKCLSSSKCSVRLPKVKKIQKTNESKMYSTSSGLTRPISPEKIQMNEKDLSCSVGLHKVKKSQKKNEKKMHSTSSGHTSPIRPKKIKKINKKYQSMIGNSPEDLEELKEKHRTSEKDRREILKDNFDSLKNLVPSLSRLPTAPKVRILTEAAAYITQLKIESKLLYEEVCELRKVEDKLYDRIDVLCSLK